MQTLDTPETQATLSTKPDKDSANIPSGNLNVESRGTKQKNVTDSSKKHFNQLLDVAKQEKKQKIDTFPKTGYVLKQASQEPMEVDSASRGNVFLETQAKKAMKVENEESLEDFVFVRSYKKRNLMK